jgi:hypothetical protein
VKHPQSQFTLLELMGLVALCALAFALLTTPASPVGAGVLVVVPGFVIERARGGTGIIGGTVSGCLIPVALALAWAVFEYSLGTQSISEFLGFFPALYSLFVLCLVWSGWLSSILYLLDRRLRGHPRSMELATGSFDPGIRFLPDDDEQRPVPRTRGEQVTTAHTSSGRPPR